MKRVRISRDVVILVVVAVAAAAGGLLLRGGEPATPVVAVDTLSGSLTLDAPASAPAGTGFVVGVRAAAGATGEVQLAVISAVGVQRVTGSLRDGAAELAVPAELVRGSGVLHLLATAGGAVGEAEVAVTAGPAVNGIVPLAGPRSMVADGAHWTMVTAIPVDALGNGLPDGTRVVLHVRRPDGTVELIDGEVRDLLDGIRVYSGTLAGLTTVRVEVAGATGPEVQVAEVPGAPLPFTLEVPATPWRADGRSLLAVTTSVLTDRYGNVLLDGTSATLVGDSPDGRVQAVATTIGGRATFHLQAPRSPGTVQVSVTVDDVTGEPLRLEVAADVTEFEVSAQRPDDLVVLRVGPVLTGLGGFAPDGTEVLVTLPGGAVEVGQLRAGNVTIEVAVPPGTRLTVEILGVRRQVVAP